MIRLAHWIWFSIIIALSSQFAASAASAQEGQPFPERVSAYWRDNTGSSTQHSTPDDACRAQWQYHNPNAIFKAPVERDWRNYDCNWDGKQAGVEAANTILPSLVSMVCPPGFATLTRSGECLRDYGEQRADQSCDCNGNPVSSAPIPMVGNPISLQNGAKVETVRDYATADGLFSVDRFYRSRQRGADGLGVREVAGFGHAWHGLVPGHLVAGGTNLNQINYYPAEGGMARFAAADTNDQLNYTYITEIPGRYRLSLIATPTVTRSAWFQESVANEGSSEVRLDFPNGDYVLYRRVGAWSTGNLTRYLVAVEHGLASGYRRYFDYQPGAPTPYQIRDSFGRTMGLTWADVSRGNPADPNGYSRTDPQASRVLTSVSLPDGTSLAYSYEHAVRTGSVATRNDRLREVRRLSSAGAVLWVRSYVYEDARFPYALTGVLDQNAARLSTFAYDQAEFAILSEHAGGADRYEVEHRRIDENSFLRIVTNPLGYRTTYRFSNPWQFQFFEYMRPHLLARIDHAATSNVPARSEIFGYTGRAEGSYLSSYTDTRNVTTALTVDAGGRPLQRIEASGRPETRTTVLTWHPTFDLPLTETLGSLRVEYSYDAQARLIQRREVDISTHSVPYATNGQTRTWTYSYSAEGRLLTTNGPRAVDAQGKDDTETYAYDAAGNLTSITNGLSHVTNFASFDANGRPATMTDANGIVTQFVYDALGRITSMSVRQPGAGTAHATTTMEYDIEGRVNGITRPATARLGMAYDLAGRLLSISAPTGEAITFTHDAMGNVTRRRVTNTASAQRSDIQRTFDELGRMLTESYGIGRTVTYAYDPQGNPTRVTSPRNFATDQAFDGLARLIQVVHPDTGSEASVYDTNDDLTSFTDPLAVETTFTYNGFGQVIREVSPDRGTSDYVYNAGGDLITATDGRGQQVDFTHDILGRVLTRTPAGLTAQQITYAYDTASISGSYSVGRLATITDPSGTTKFKYDHRGNVITRQQVISGSPTLTLSMTYDLADRVLRITYPSGRWADYARDAQGRVETITMLRSGAPSVTTLASAMTYEPFGALATATLGNGQVHAQVRDDMGRMTARRYRTAASANIWSVAYSYDADENITAITDLVQSSGDLALQYDGVNRLSRVDMSTGATRREDYIHDVGGNRVRVERRAAITDVNPASQDTYSRTSGTNRIASVTTPAGTRSFTHDGRGNLSAEDRPGTNDVTVGYDGYARLTSYVRTGEASLTMAYNGMDQRVALVSGGVTRRFVYDMDGRLLGEYGPNGSQFFAEYIWMLPEVGDAGTFGGDDGTGGWTPLAVAASNGAGASQTFHWLHTSHLGVPVGSYNAGGTATTLTGITLLGFPGQTQTLADLYYNQYRDYDPTTGRYLQADPIGLAGDVNPYVYAGANPVGMSDPWGLDTFLNLFPDGEQIHDGANADIARRERYNDPSNRVLNIYGHGGTNAMCDRASNGPSCMRGADFGRWLRRNHARELRGQSAIVLWSCQTGRLDDGFAQQLANELGVVVFAPTAFVWFYPDRYDGNDERFSPGRRDTSRPGRWRIFEPRVFTR